MKSCLLIHFKVQWLNFNQALEPIRERRRINVSKGWWSWLKGNSVTFEPIAMDVARSLMMASLLIQATCLSISTQRSVIETGTGCLLWDIKGPSRKRQSHRSENQQRQGYDQEAAKRKLPIVLPKIKEDIDFKHAEFSELEERNQ
jgi:hypothetical protein